jgi:hypothetical protein
VKTEKGKERKQQRKREREREKAIIIREKNDPEARPAFHFRRIEEKPRGNVMSFASQYFLVSNALKRRAQERRQRLWMSFVSVEQLVARSSIRAPV